MTRLRYATRALGALLTTVLLGGVAPVVAGDLGFAASLLTGPLHVQRVLGDGSSGFGTPHTDRIGFPAVATHGVRQWKPMIVWRERSLTTGDSRLEPIAGIACMGLKPHAVALRADRYDVPILALAVRYGLSASLLKAVVTAESCFDPAARSSVGALGLMQLMPATARWLGVDDPHDPQQNLAAGARYLASLLEEFGELELALAAYNAGPGTVRRVGGIPRYPETQSYVGRVLGHYRRYVVATRIASR